MASDAERMIRLILKVAGTEEFQRLKDAAGETKESLEEVAEAATEASDAMEGADDAIDAATQEMEESRARVDSLLESIAGGASGGGGLAGAFAGLATGMLPVVGQLLQSKAAMEALAWAASAAFSALSSALEDYYAGENTIAGIADTTERLNASLETTNKRISELREKQNLTNAEFAEYNRLVAERKQVEAEAKEAEAGVSSLESLRNKEREARRSKEGADIVEDAIAAAGGVDAVLNTIIAAMGGSDLTEAARTKLESEELVKQNRGDLAGFDKDKFDEAAAKYDALLAKATDQAEQMLGAAVRGETWAAQSLTGYAPGLGFEAATEGGLRQSALARKQMEDAAFTEKQQADNEAIAEEERKARMKARDDYDKAQEKAEKDQERAEARAAKDAERANAQAAREWKAAMASPEGKAAFDEWFNDNVAWMFDDGAVDESSPAARRKAIRSGVESEIAAMGWMEGPNAMAQGDLNKLINDATNRAKGTDVSSISMAIDEALAALTDKIASEIQRSMRRSNVQSNSHYAMW